jgi:hypothetical protein
MPAPPPQPLGSPPSPLVGGRGGGRGAGATWAAPHMRRTQPLGCRGGRGHRLGAALATRLPRCERVEVVLVPSLVEDRDAARPPADGLALGAGAAGSNGLHGARAARLEQWVGGEVGGQLRGGQLLPDLGDGTGRAQLRRLLEQPASAAPPS